mmetsp:Transcript_63397/g.139513  ORF Transcript_63397/g.139513 Transcript_63397/m.139513 type:complete len:190 (-) Transcript_63397:76-645(-)
MNGELLPRLLRGGAGGADDYGDDPGDGADASMSGILICIFGGCIALGLCCRCICLCNWSELDFFTARATHSNSDKPRISNRHGSIERESWPSPRGEKMADAVSPFDEDVSVAGLRGHHSKAQGTRRPQKDVAKTAPSELENSSPAGEHARVESPTLLESDLVAFHIPAPPDLREIEYVRPVSSESTSVL